MPTLLSSGFRLWSYGPSLIRRTAGCGPACPGGVAGESARPLPLCRFLRTAGCLPLPCKDYNQLRCCVNPRPILVLLGICVLSASAFAADEKKSSSLTEQHRMELIRTFSSDLVYIRTQFPMGKVGLTIKEGKLSPNREELSKLLALWGPSVKPGDRAIITQFLLKNDRMHLEINGCPVKKTKWYQRIQVGAGGGVMTPGGTQNDPINNPRGSYV